jgi:hypothetical protein
MPNSIDPSHPWIWLFFVLLAAVFTNGRSDYTMFGRRRRPPRGAKKAQTGAKAKK